MATAVINNLAETWNNAGTTFTAIKMNVTDTASQAASLLMDLQVASTTKFNVTKAGLVTAAGNIVTADTGKFVFGARGSVEATADGVFAMKDTAGTAFSRLMFGGATSSFPAIKRNSAALNFRLADDSADAAITCAAITSSGSVTAAAASKHDFTGRGGIAASADGVLNLLDTAGTSFSRLTFGGTSSSFPAIKRNSAALNFRLADDSADAAITCAGITASGGYSGTTVSGTGVVTAVSGTAVPAGGANTAGFKFTSTANLGVFVGSGAPTLSAAQGSIYLRTDGSSTSTRLYVNTNGTTGWTNFTSAT